MLDQQFLTSATGGRGHLSAVGAGGGGEQPGSVCLLGVSMLFRCFSEAPGTHEDALQTVKPRKTTIWDDSIGKMGSQKGPEGCERALTGSQP